MDNISKILEAIKAEGQAEADKIIAAGKKNADDVSKLYAEEANVEETAIQKKAEKEAAEIAQRGISQAGIESRNIKLKARRQALEKAFVLAEAGLEKLSENQKQMLYQKIVKHYSSKQSATIILNKADKNAFGEELTAELNKTKNLEVKLSQKTGDFAGGLIIQEGEIETNCTFEVLIGDTKKQIESSIAAMLFS